MAPIKSLIAPLVCLLLLAACEKKDVSTPNSTPSAEVPAKPTSGEAVGDATSFIGASNALAMDLFDEVRKKKGNLLFSPASISVAFSMTYAGANGETAAEMRKVLHLPEGDAIHDSAGKVLRGWNAEAGHTLRSVNRLFGAKEYTFVPAFLARTRDSYAAPLEPVDFAASPDAARKHINQWVMEQTQDRIDELLPGASINDRTKLVLVNAIYFLGQWAHGFDASRTSQQPFIGESGQTMVPMMSQTATHGYLEVEGAQILELAYEGSPLVMTVMLPKDPAGLDAIEKRFSTQFGEWVAALKKQEVSVLLPRFEMKGARIPLVENLKALGMNLAFDPAKADFTNMSKPANAASELYISDAFHEAFVKVDEKGTEAAAATAVVMAPRGAAPVVTTFRADRPFLFTIRDAETGAILFVGRVANPS